MTLGEKQYELGGVSFGLGLPIAVNGEGWQPGSATSRNQDLSLPSSDGIRFGKDYKAESVWAFSMHSDEMNEVDAWASVAELSKAWDAKETRLTSGAVLPLRYRVAGVTRRIYGRPRRWSIVPNNLSMSGRIDIEADFTAAHPLFFDDEEQTRTLNVGSAIEADSGFTVPFTPPWSSSPGNLESQSTITVGGEEDTPLVLKLTANGAPLNNPIVSVAGIFTVAINDTIEPGNPVTIDARPWARSITTAAGGGVEVSPRVTRLSKAWLPPGSHDVIFSGEDITSTATLLISWRGAYSSPR
jgi:hypothetical protein